MSITTKWKIILGAVIVVLICGIEDIKCCSGGGDKTNEGHGIDPGEAKGSPINITDFVAGDAFIEEDDGVDHVMEAIENGIDYEGDMVLTNEQLDLHKGRAATSQLDKKWPKVGDMVQIPYVISSSFSQRDRNVIAKALQQYESKTCLRFVFRSSEANYISIIKANGCWSYIGQTRGKQQISLGNGCVYNGVIIHEFMHAIGFEHEQTRSDRDDHVTIHFQNIQANMEHNFAKCTRCNNQGLSYDLGSVMHYSQKAFSKNNQNTISCKSGSCQIGNKNGFSELDITGINKLYECMGGTGPTTSTCVDEDTYCPNWKQYGFCTGFYGPWMSKHCQKSCGICTV